jgi:hypothetical protein
MANITVTTNAQLQLEVTAMEVLDELHELLVLAWQVARPQDYDPSLDLTSPRQRGDVINIKSPGALTASDKAADTEVVAQAPTPANVAITLDTHKYVTIRPETIPAATSFRSLFSLYDREQIQALADALEDDLWTLIQTFSFSVGTAGTALGESAVLAADRELFDNLARGTQKFLNITSADAAAIQALDRFNSGAIRGLAPGANDGGDRLTGARANGFVGSWHGFEIYRTQKVPVIAASPDWNANVGLYRHAICLASPPLEMPLGGALGAVATHPDTGISVRVTSGWNQGHLANEKTVDVVYGMDIVRDEFGVLVKT